MSTLEGLSIVIYCSLAGVVAIITYIYHWYWDLNIPQRRSLHVYPRAFITLTFNAHWIGTSWPVPYPQVPLCSIMELRSKRKMRKPNIHDNVAMPEAYLLTRTSEIVRTLIFELSIGNLEHELLSSIMKPEQPIRSTTRQARGAGIGSKSLTGRRWLLALPLTCKQLSRESLRVLYSSNVFRVFLKPTLYKMVADFPSQNLMAIRRMSLYYQFSAPPSQCADALRDWEQFWAFVETAFGAHLSELTVYIGIWTLSKQRIVLTAGPKKTEDRGLWLRPAMQCAIPSVRVSLFPIEEKSRNIHDIRHDIRRELSDRDEYRYSRPPDGKVVDLACHKFQGAIFETLANGVRGRIATV